MASSKFKLKNINAVFGIDGETSEEGTPVFSKKLDDGVGAEANRDGTIFVDESLNASGRRKAVEHEKIHLEQIAQGRLQYSNDSVTWKKDTRSPARVYKRSDMKEGASNLEWEAEAYNKTKK